MKSSNHATKLLSMSNAYKTETTSVAKIAATIGAYPFTDAVNGPHAYFPEQTQCGYPVVHS